MISLQISRGRFLALAIFFGTLQTLVSNQVRAQATTPPGTIARTAPAVDPAADVVCEHLMADYILRQQKIESTTIDAAIQLIAARSRGGYWQTVYKHFQNSEINNNGFTPSRNLLRILTIILARDGGVRWSQGHRSDKPIASILTVTLPAEVLDTIIDRARKADRLQIDSYVFAVATAYDPRSKPFLLDVWRGRLPNETTGPTSVTGPKSDPPPPASPPRIISAAARLNAAIGLANLGEREALAWLVETEFADSAIHEARLRALSDLTGQPQQPRENWRAWWQQNPVPDRFEPKAQAHLISR
jgi:hypothetical protein